MIPANAIPLIVDAILWVFVWVCLSFGFFFLIPIGLAFYIRWRKRQEGSW